MAKMGKAGVIYAKGFKKGAKAGIDYSVKRSKEELTKMGEGLKERITILEAGKAAGRKQAAEVSAAQTEALGKGLSKAGTKFGLASLPGPVIAAGISAFTVAVLYPQLIDKVATMGPETKFLVGLAMFVILAIVIYLIIRKWRGY